MKLHLMPKEPTWWIWVVTIAFLSAGQAGYPAGFVAAILLSAAQAAVFFLTENSGRSYPLQIRVAFTVLLVVCQLPFLRTLLWLPTLGTLAFVLFGYCPMARLLSLLPGNRREPLSAGLLRRTFFTPPQPGNVRHGLPGSACHREARAAFSSRTSTQN